MIVEEVNLDILFIIIDLFCGGGGTSTGFENAEIDGKPVSVVIAAVNHDENAIESHAANYPHTKHYFEDIRKLNVDELKVHLEKMRKLYPNAKVVLHASLECTNFSNAKGGMARDADSRTLANDLLYRVKPMIYAPQVYNDMYKAGQGIRKAVTIYQPSYIPILEPDYVTIENVVEFMAWGPLDENGKPLSRKNGIDFRRWCNKVDALGYRHEWTQLDSADFGAYTKRNRLFGIFAKNNLPIAFPKPTHANTKKKAKKGKANNLFGFNEAELQPYRAVREVLDLNDKGESIFTRKKPLSDKTMARIYAGLIKFIAGGKEAFGVKYMGNDKKTGVNNGFDLDNPCLTVTTQNRLFLCQPSFLTKYFSGHPDSKNISVNEPAHTIKPVDNHALVNMEFLQQRNGGDPASKVVDINGPARTITGTGGNQELVSPEFLQLHYSTGDNVTSVDNPCPTLSTKDRAGLVQPQFIAREFSSGGGQHNDIELPAGTVMPNPKMNLVTTEFITTTNFAGAQTTLDEPCKTITADRHHHYLVNPQWGEQTGDINNPCFTLIARMDKMPPYLVCTEQGEVFIEVFKTDSEIVVKIKEFMAMYGIVDIKMRMLKIIELLQIQGFPIDYKLIGTQTEQKKYIGNSVVPIVARRMLEALATELIEHYKMAA